jgi:PA domain
LFGVPPYGGSIQQQLYYTESDICDPNVDTRSGYPKRDNDSSGKMKPWASPYILMVNRGGCTFVNKVRNAQRSGAAGVIIADTTCLCSAGDSCQSDVECEAREPIMADDGSGSDITIPSFLVFKQDADIIKKEIMQDHAIRIEMAWSLPNPDARVEYELWTTPTDLVSREFQRQFKEAAVALGSHAYFTPHMYIYDGIKSGCRGIDGSNQCYNLCTNTGRYCATDPDNDLDKGISGADVVKESLRRQCIWKIYGETDGIGKEWWDYVAEFMYRCDNEDYFASEDCVKDAMSHSGVENHKVVDCISDSGGLDGDGENTILEAQLNEKEASGVVILPATYVNNAAIRGALEFATIFKAICAGYSKGSAPNVCEKCANCGIDEYQCVVDGRCPDGSGSVSVPVFTTSLAAIVFCFGCIGLIQWQRTQRQMREQVRGIMAEYMPLDENNKVESAGIPLDDEDADFT